MATGQLGWPSSSGLTRNGDATTLAGAGMHAGAQAEDAPQRQITYYHSLLYRTLSWENPRKTFTSYLSILSVILALQFLPLLRWFFKVHYIVLGLTVAFEVAGKILFNHGLASSSRPRKYYTVPRETLDSLLEDAEQLFDFFLIEFQRVIFVENLLYTIATFLTSLTAYVAVLIFPLWVLAILGVSTAYFAPLIYLTNKPLIDAELADLELLVTAQIQHAKTCVLHQTTRAHSAVRGFVDEKQAQAHEFVVARSNALKEAAANAQARRAAIRQANANATANAAAGAGARAGVNGLAAQKRSEAGLLTEARAKEAEDEADEREVAASTELAVAAKEMEEVKMGSVESSPAVVSPPAEVSGPNSAKIETVPAPSGLPSAPKGDLVKKEEDAAAPAAEEAAGLAQRQNEREGATAVLACLI